jgi:DNA-binding GntR family transcriptional regulator
MSASEAAARSPSDAQMYQRMLDALREQRLRPGTRLAEDKLGRVFGVSRTRVRQLLIRLASQQLVTLVPNAGARVASPSPQEAAEVFEVRRLVEPAVVAGFIAHAKASEVQALKRFIHEEESARLRLDKGAAVRLAGNFHLHLADHCGNQTLARLMHELVARTVLVLICYGPADLGEPAPPRARGRRACECTEHRALWAAIHLREVELARNLMQQHLQRLQAQLDFEPQAAADDDLSVLLAPVAA